MLVWHPARMLLSDTDGAVWNGCYGVPDVPYCFPLSPEEAVPVYQGARRGVSNHISRQRIYDA